jgi:hypothetical protein
MLLSNIIDIILHLLQSGLRNAARTNVPVSAEGVWFLVRGQRSIDADRTRLRARQEIHTDLSRQRGCEKTKSEEHVSPPRTIMAWAVPVVVILGSDIYQVPRLAEPLRGDHEQWVGRQIRGTGLRHLTLGRNAGTMCVSVGVENP